MALELEPIVKVRTYEEVVHRIQDEILSGRLRGGDRLPGERRLSEMLGVSRPTLREALRVLETLEILEPSVRSGPDGGPLVRAKPGEALYHLLRTQLALHHYSMRDLVETRYSLEVAAVAWASRRAQPEHIERLEGIVARMREPGLDRETYNELDTSFHASIAPATGNALIGQLMFSIRGAIKDEMLDTFERVADWDETRDRLTAEHAAILDAIKGGDVARAEQVVRTHLIDFEPRWRAEAPTDGSTVTT
jgi:GntR family transcriptional regulator, transcriptional repressor for pyruvate dehydrogenase complex